MTKPLFFQVRTLEVCRNLQNPIVNFVNMFACKLKVRIYIGTGFLIASEEKSFLLKGHKKRIGGRVEYHMNVKEDNKL